MSSGERPPGAEAREPSNAGAVSEPADDRSDGGAADDGGAAGEGAGDPPDDVARYERFKKVDGARYDRVNDFLRDRTHITAREWAIARLCADFRTETGVEMTKIGEHLPELVPFMTDTYTPQAVNQARASFEEKVRMAGATFLYGAMCDFFTAEELDDVIYEATETAKFLLEVEGVDLTVEEELAAEDRISDVMREVRAASEALRNGPVECPDCGHTFGEETVE
jgi:predicted Zn-ribbon and HTH transcriptional regulator